MTRVLDWNGKDVPEGLRDLPAGRYVLEPVDEELELTAEQEEGLRQALASIAEGKGRSLEEVRRSIAASLAQ